MVKDLYVIAFILIWILAAVGFIQEIIFLHYLKKRHFDAWRKLGEPVLFYNASIKIQQQMKLFETSGDYLKLNDSKLNRMIFFRNRFYFCYCFILIIGFLLFVLTFIFK